MLFRGKRLECFLFLMIYRFKISPSCLRRMGRSETDLGSRKTSWSIIAGSTARGDGGLDHQPVSWLYTWREGGCWTCACGTGATGSYYRIGLE